MKWPHGKYNGRRIVGVNFKIEIDITDWNLWPVIVWKWSGFVHWLCVRTWSGWTYDEVEKRP